MAAGNNSHKHSTSVSQAQNHKAQLANAYNELGKELSSQKIRVVGNYTLGKVIGEGMSSLLPCLTHEAHSPSPLLQGLTARCAWACTD